MGGRRLGGWQRPQSHVDATYRTVGRKCNGRLPAWRSVDRDFHRAPADPFWVLDPNRERPFRAPQLPLEGTPIPRQTRVNQ